MDCFFRKNELSDVIKPSDVLKIKNIHVDSSNQIKDIERKIDSFMNKNDIFYLDSKKFNQLSDFIKKTFQISNVEFLDDYLNSNIYHSVKTKLLKQIYVLKYKKPNDIKLNYEMISSTADIKKWLNKKVPVILSVRWNHPFYFAFADLRDNERSINSLRKRNVKEKYASDEVIKKAMNRIISYPNEEYIKSISGENDNITHAVLCVGYDAGDKAFICKDYLSNNPLFKGFFKIEEKCFFDKTLLNHKIQVIDAAVAIYVDEFKD